MLEPPRSPARAAAAATRAAALAASTATVAPVAPVGPVAPPTFDGPARASTPHFVPTPDPPRRLPRSVQLLLWLAAALMLKAAEAFAVPVLYAVLLTLLLSSPVRRLGARGIRPPIAAAIVVGGMLLAVGLVGFAVVKPASDWWHRAPASIEHMVSAFDRLRAAVLSPFGGRQRDRAEAPASVPRAASDGASAPATPANAAITEKVASEGYSLTRSVLGGTLHFTFSAVATVILLYFLLASQDQMLVHALQRVPPGRRRALVLGGIRQVQRDVRLFIGTMCLVNAALGVATGLGLALIGLPNAVLWGTVTAVLTCIPYLGPLLVAVALLFAGGVDGGGLPGLLGPTSLFLALHGIEAWAISPALMGHRLRLAPAAVIVAVMLWGWIWGVAGALLAVPLLLALRIVCRRTPSLRRIGAFIDGRQNGALPSLQSLLRQPSTGASAPGRAHSVKHHTS